MNQNQTDLPDAAHCAECGVALAPCLPLGLCSNCALIALLEQGKDEAPPCPKCRAPVPQDAPAGQCPSCLLEMADDPGSEGDSVARMSQSHERQFGDYILGRQLGSGGMGIVYDARQISLNRRVAIKFIRDSRVASPLMLRRFTIEAEAAARLHHPNIVSIHEIGEIDGQPYFSMDLVDGDSLRMLMSRGEFTLQTGEDSKFDNRKRQEAVARLVAKTARALHHAHQRGVLHRDLKPANILIDAAGEPRLSDFGLAKILRLKTETDTRQSLTGTGDIAGTPSYMSPEQASSGEITGTTDVYGLGAVLYELLTKKPPFRGHTVLDTLRQVRESPPKAPRAINRLIERDLENICLKCLEKDPLRRFATAETLAEDLENWIERKPIKARPVGIVVRALQWMRRNRTGTALIGSLIIGLSAAVVLLAVVNHHAGKRDLLAARLFDGKTLALTERWNDPNTSTLTISSEDLAILSDRDPVVADTALSVTIGAVIWGDAVNFAQRHAAHLCELESTLSQVLGQPVRVSLTVSKWHVPDTALLKQKQVDFAIVDATSFLEAQRDRPGLIPLARIRSSLTNVLVTIPRTGITNLATLSGKTVLVSSRRGPSTIAVKATLAQAGLLMGHVRTVIGDQELFRRTYREVVSSLNTNQAHAGAVTLQRFHVEHRNKLVSLAQLPVIERIVAARSGLDPELVAAFQTALLRVNGIEPETRLKDETSWEEESAFGAVPLEASYLETVRGILRDAARFDGEPDPFPVTKSAQPAMSH